MADVEKHVLHFPEFAGFFTGVVMALPLIHTSFAGKKPVGVNASGQDLPDQKIEFQFFPSFFRIGSIPSAGIRGAGQSRAFRDFEGMLEALDKFDAVHGQPFVKTSLSDIGCYGEAVYENGPMVSVSIHRGISNESGAEIKTKLALLRIYLKKKADNA
jgi:hypothetical protein